MLLLTLAGAVLFPSAALGMPSLCGETGECVCITWITGGGATVEVRCPANGGSPSGWSTSGDPRDADGGDGSFGGSGNPSTLPSTLPGTVLNPTTGQNVNNAKNAAIQKLRGTKIVDEGTPKGTFEPNACTNLFLNSPLGMTGGQILGSYVTFRDGTNVKDSNNVNVCATNVPAWTTCCNHDRIVYICPGSFNSMSANDRMWTLIHEALHVGGQLEDKDTTVGPNDPPNSSQIGADVKKACP
jgi:hypothetical protein